MKRWELFEEAVIAGAGLVLGFMVTMAAISAAGGLTLHAFGVF